MKKQLLALAVGMALVLSMATGCEKKSKEFPQKEITVVVPWSPGGTNDLMARALQPVFKEKFNVDLVVKLSLIHISMKDAVCSPGGTTIVGVAALERRGFRSAVIDAIDAIEKKK